MWQELFETVRQQRAFLDLFTRGWIGDYEAGGGTIHCRKGCSGCCNLAVNTTFPEAAMIAGELSDEQAAAVREHVGRLIDRAAGINDLKEYLRMHRREMGGCPLLTDQGNCGIYRHRPLACRSLLSTRESRWCSVDFAELPAAEKREYSAGLDTQVVAFPLHYVKVVQDTAQELETGSSKLMWNRFGLSLYGNLPVLLLLAREHGLAEACNVGRDEVLRVIANAGVKSPFLVTAEV